MNKTINLIIAFLFLFITAQAQEVQEKQPKIKYSGIIESGLIFSTEHLSSQQTFVNGIKINDMHTVGFGVGFGVLVNYEADLTMPMYANYRVNFLPEKRSPFINVAAGVALTEEALNLYSGLTAGIRFYIFSLSSGINVQTVGKEAKPLVGFIIQIGIQF
jgi:hypothetical protein